MYCTSIHQLRSSLFCQDVTSRSWFVAWVSDLKSFFEEGEEAVRGKERCALRRWVENKERVQSEKCFKTYLLFHHQASVILWTTSRKSSSFPLSFFPTQSCGSNYTLHFHFCCDLNVKNVCCCSEDQRILFPSMFTLFCGTWSSWSLISPFLP